MGLLDEVISAALKSGAGQNQSPRQSGPTQDALSQIAVALQELLAPKADAAPTARASPSQSSPSEQGGLGGLDVLVNKFNKNGLEDIINSWIGTGQNKTISPSQVRQAIGRREVDDLSRQTGTAQDDLLAQLAKYLPTVIDKLTPNGRLPAQADLQTPYRRS